MLITESKSKETIMEYHHQVVAYSVVGRIVYHYWNGQGVYTTDDFGNSVRVDVMLARRFIAQTYQQGE